VDRDEFSWATRLARKVVEDLRRALDGGACDSFNTLHLLERLFSRAGGVPSLAPVMEVVRTAADPLLATRVPEWAADQVDAEVREHGEGTLDLVLNRVAQRELLACHASVDDICRAFVNNVLERHSKNGLLEEIGARRVFHEREHIFGLLQPAVSQTAAKLVANPRAKRLSLVGEHRLGPTDNLLREPS
jgi:hypothetical protein